MILPSKHIRLSESLFGLGAVLSEMINEPRTIDDLWFKFSEINNTKTKFPAYHSFDNVVLALNCLFLMGVIGIDNQGKIYNEIIRA